MGTSRSSQEEDGSSRNRQQMLALLPQKHLPRWSWHLTAVVETRAWPTGESRGPTKNYSGRREPFFPKCYNWIAIANLRQSLVKHMVCVFARLCVSVYMHVCVNECMQVYVYMPMCMCVHVCCMYVCVLVCLIFVFPSILTEMTGCPLTLFPGFIKYEHEICISLSLSPPKWRISLLFFPSSWLSV